MTLKGIETPGHKADHMSYLLESNSGEYKNLLFPGDTILGTPSTTFDCLISYMKSLDKMLALNPDELMLSHHLDGSNYLVEDARSKIESYIRYRKARETELLRMVHGGKNDNLHAIDGGRMTLGELFN